MDLISLAAGFIKVIDRRAAARDDIFPLKQVPFGLGAHLPWGKIMRETLVTRQECYMDVAVMELMDAIY
jgi:hypothetical protein